MPTHDNQSLGRLGEDLACREFRRRGYAILARRYRTRRGELDIVARRGRTLVFIEVKTRASVRFGLPCEAVTAVKRRRLGELATGYLVQQGIDDVVCRFDVVEVVAPPSGRPSVRVIEGAFDPPGAW